MVVLGGLAEEWGMAHTAQESSKQRRPNKRIPGSLRGKPVRSAHAEDKEGLQGQKASSLQHRVLWSALVFCS